MLDDQNAKSMSIVVTKGTLDWAYPPFILASTAAALGYAHQNIVSGAGHDACQVSRTVPVGMIFVPCENGISHNEEESAEPADLEAGCNVLLHAMLELAGTPAD